VRSDLLEYRLDCTLTVCFSGIYIALLFSHCILVSMTTKFLARMHFVSIFLNIGYVINDNFLTFCQVRGSIYLASFS
jgi:hypothetical protein